MLDKALKMLGVDASAITPIMEQFGRDQAATAQNMAIIAQHLPVLHAKLDRLSAELVAIRLQLIQRPPPGESDVRDDHIPVAHAAAAAGD